MMMYVEMVDKNLKSGVKKNLAFYTGDYIFNPSDGKIVYK